VENSFRRLVIIIFEVLSEKVDFVFVVSLRITMWSLFNLTGSNGFGGLGFTMLQLFSVTMGSVDYLLIQDYANGVGLNASLGSVDSSQSSIIKTVNVHSVRCCRGYNASEFVGCTHARDPRSHRVKVKTRVGLHDGRCDGSVLCEAGEEPVMDVAMDKTF